jgi:hypothetical protein
MGVEILGYFSPRPPNNSNISTIKLLAQICEEIKKNNNKKKISMVFIIF